MILFLDESLSLSLSVVLSVALLWTNKYSLLENYSPILRSMILGSPACRAVLMCVAALELDVSQIILDQHVVLRSLGLSIYYVLRNGGAGVVILIYCNRKG